MLNKKKTAENAAEISPESAFEGWYREIFHTGSRVICNPPPTDTDDDYLLLVGEGAVKALEDKLVKEGYTLGGSLHTGGLHEKEDPLDFDSFASYKKGHFNVILTCNDEYFLRFKKATLLARELNLLKKEDRVTLFEAVVRDKYPEEKKSGWPRMYTTDAVRRNIRVRLPNNFNVNPPIIGGIPIRVQEAPIAAEWQVIPEQERNEADILERAVNQEANQMIAEAEPLRAIDVVDRIRERNVIQGDVQEVGQAAVDPAVWLVNWGDNHVDNAVPV